MSVDKEEREFWDNIILNDDGTVDMEAVYAELHDYRFIASQVSHVYNDITCGQLSKPTYYAQDVIAVANDCADKIVRSEVYAILLDLDDGSTTLDELLKEYSEDDDD